MAFRRIEVHSDQKYARALMDAAKACRPIDIRHTDAPGEGRQVLSILVRPEAGQNVVDEMHKVLRHVEDWRLFVVTVEATLPRVESEEGRERTSGKETGKKSGSIREEVFEDVVANGRLSLNYLILTTLSAIVAAIGLNMDSVAVVIGAMVIAPLLGPQLAFSFAIAMGSRTTSLKAAATALVGTALSILLSIGIAQIIDVNSTSQELMSRTFVDVDGIILALAAGAAAALSILTGLSATLVGVMVAVALLPPATVAGLMIGIGDNAGAVGALALLAVNIICVNLAAQLVFVSQGVGPRSDSKRGRALAYTWVSIFIWGGLLAAFIFNALPALERWTGAAL